MKRTASAFPLMLCICVFILYCILPLCHIASLITGYNFTLYNYPVYIAVLATLSLIAAVYFIVSKTYPVPGSALLAFLLPLSVYNAVPAFKSDFDFVFIFVFLSIGSSAILFFKDPRLVTKILSAVVTGVLLIIFITSSYLHSVFGNLSNNAAVKSVPSPDNSYTAEVISSDQGALGGNTFVEIRFNSKTINILIGEFTKPSARIYSGEYSEFENMQISWKDNQTLLINGAEYKIDD